MLECYHNQYRQHDIIYIFIHQTGSKNNKTNKYNNLKNN